ncbi:HD-GYP domain-containing protein [Fundidesulfovibrio soli]|uniref:HD-GYP domain-containing protein n=1 Tax=Fundidesulfovibrio soli TaxID=2922716 RepID=UPI001FB02F86|nr:HD-GYP domain-containing protein [Fundidesulfovibrio soli]
MYIANPGLSGQSNPHVYLCEGLLSDEASIEKIAPPYCDAYIDTEQGAYFNEHPEEKANFESLFNSIVFSGGRDDNGEHSLDDILENLKAADANYSEMLEQYKAIARKMYGAQTVDVAACEKLTESLVVSEEKMLLALLLVSRMRTSDPYAYTHSLNVSMLGVMAARALGYGQDTQLVFGMSGIFHDIGKTLIPDRILRKSSRLTTAEFEEIKRHPVYARKLLSQHRDMPEDVVHVAHEHHEHHDGSGYPRGLKGPEINRVAAAISVLDTYDALRSDRYYKEAVSSHKAICVVYSLRGKSFDPQLADKFIKTVGIYPVGTIVKLESGMKGIVTRQNGDNLLRPHIRLILDGNNRYCERRDVNLLDEDSKGPYAIKDTLTNKECRIHVSSLMS